MERGLEGPSLPSANLEARYARLKGDKLNSRIVNRLLYHDLYI